MTCARTIAWLRLLCGARARLVSQPSAPVGSLRTVVQWYTRGQPIPSPYPPPWYEIVRWAWNDELCRPFTLRGVNCAEDANVTTPDNRKLTPSCIPCWK